MAFSYKNSKGRSYILHSRVTHPAERQQADYLLLRQ